MRESEVRVEPSGWLRRCLGVSWAELQLPERTTREAPVEGRLQIQPLDGLDRTVTVRFGLWVVSEYGPGNSTSWTGWVTPAEQRVRLEGGWRAEVPFRGYFPAPHDSTRVGGVNAHIQGAWGWEVGVSACFGLVPPAHYAALAERIGALTGCGEVVWGVSATDAGHLIYAAKLRQAGEPHPLLNEVVLELNENSGRVYATLGVVEGPGNGVRRSRPPSLSFQFPTGDAHPDLREVREFLRPYDSRLRSKPIPGSGSNREAHLTLPLPAVGGGGAGENLPVPSCAPEEK